MTQIVTCVEDMEAVGASLLKNLPPPAIIYLRGNLGAGKTTLVRGALRQLGHQGLVKSPTFTLVETYPFPEFEVHHLDLYRINDPEELDYIGLREYCSGPTICFIEWPDMGKPLLPKPTHEISIQYIETGRQVTISDCR